MNSTKIITEEHYPELLNLFQKEFGTEVICYEPMTAHGSDRKIIRLRNNSTHNAIGIFNENVAENKAFINFGAHFRKHGLNVPEVFQISDDFRFYLLEDLGDTTLLNKIKENPSKEFGTNEIELYKKALRILPEFQITAGQEIDYGLCYQFDEFGSDNIDYDFGYFRERFLKLFYKNILDEDLLQSDFSFLKTKVLQMPPKYFLYRDFQSRNIMIKNDELFFIDFQSGRKGFLLYDLASLLYDAKAKIPQPARELLIDFYLDLLNDYLPADKTEMKNIFWYFAIIRILQAMGAYGFLGIVKGKEKFLESVPYALNNINFILNNRIDISELNYLRKIFGILLNE